MLVQLFAVVALTGPVSPIPPTVTPTGTEEAAPVERNLNAILSEDERVAARLEVALAGFLAGVRAGDFPEELVDPEQLSRFAFFFEGLRGLGSKAGFDPPRVLRSYSPDGEAYFVTLAFSGVRDGAPFLYKVVEVLARPRGESYRFECPFPERTADLRVHALGSVRFHARGPLDKAAASEFRRFKESFADLTGTQDEELDYYVFRSLGELLEAYGFLFDATKCNFLARDLGFSDDDGRVFVTGTGRADYIAEYVRDHLQLRVPGAQELYPPFVTGMAVYYGGYFLSGDSLSDLKAQFREKLAREPEVDFLEEFKKGRKSSVERHFSYYVMSAFLCEQVVARHGVPAALELAHSGPQGERFFEGLQDLLGVDESNFHRSIVGWIQG